MSEKAATVPSVIVRRTVDALPERVFAAWTEPQHLLRWWRVNPAWTTPSAEVDLQVGGKYRLSMRDPEQSFPYTCYGEFREIDPQRKLVYTWSWEPPNTDVGVTLVTVEFVPQGTATEIVVTHSQFPNAETAADHEKGWGGCIDSLARVVENN